MSKTTVAYAESFSSFGLHVAVVVVGPRHQGLLLIASRNCGRALRVPGHHFRDFGVERTAVGDICCRENRFGTAFVDVVAGPWLAYRGFRGWLGAGCAPCGGRWRIHSTVATVVCGKKCVTRFATDAHVVGLGLGLVRLGANDAAEHVSPFAFNWSCETIDAWRNNGGLGRKAF